MNAVVVQYQISDMERIARAFAVSKLFGVQNVEQAMALCLVAQAEGRHPATAAQDYHIIQGRPAKKADAMLRDFLAGGGKVEWHTLSDDKADATFTHPSGGAARIDWTMARAKQAGIANPMWAKYPRQMLRARVVSEGVRTVFPMATSGMYVPEEVAEFEPVTASPTPAPVETVSGSALPAQARLEAPTARVDGIKRLSSSRAKEIGLDKEIKDAVAGCTTHEELMAWKNEPKHTAQAPMSWLDSIDNMVLLRAEEITVEQGEGDEAQRLAAYDAEFDAAFKGAIGPKQTADAPA